MSYREQYDFWLKDAYFDEATKEELRSIAGNEGEIEDRFYKELEFGTGGLRGVIGAGTNRMNIYTVRKATQGLANYITSRAAGTEVWRSPMTQEGCLPNLQMKQHSASVQMESRHMYLMH